MKPSDVIISTHKKDGEIILPHLQWLKKTNPDVKIHVLVGEDSSHGKRYNWKNSDQQVRKWWIDNHEEISGDLIALIEWDTLVGVEFPDVKADLAGAKLITRGELKNLNDWKAKSMTDPTWKNENWYWWGDLKIMGMEQTPPELTIGLISFGMYFVRKWVMSAICDSKWNYVFEKSVQNELRFPTIAKIEGARVEEINLPFVTYQEREITNTAGIYHGIKKEIDLDFWDK